MKAVTTPPQRPVLTEYEKLNTKLRRFKFKLERTLGGDGPVMDISCSGQTSAAVGLSKDYREIPVIILNGSFINDPICQTREQNAEVDWATGYRKEFERTVFRGVAIKQGIIRENAGLVRERKLSDVLVRLLDI